MASAEKRCFVVKLVTPRPTFAFDMNDSERKLMRDHAEYWQSIVKQGCVVVFGPGMEPAQREVWSCSKVEDESLPKIFIEDDPTMRSGLGFAYEIHPMRDGWVRR